VATKASTASAARAAFYPLIPDATLVPQLFWTINAGSSFRFF
jgi:hypothetical protein